MRVWGRVELQERVDPAVLSVGRFRVLRSYGGRLGCLVALM